MKELILILFLSFLSAKSFALPTAPFDALKSRLAPPLYLDSKDYDFEGIVKLSNCSGSIIKFKGQSLEDQALVLTNGHCLGGRFLKNGQVVYKKKSRRRMRVADSNMKFHRVRAQEIVYATMTGTDSAIYKLRETFQDLEKLGIEPFELSDNRPLEGQEIQIISGYWERGYSCSIESFIYQLKEADWLWNDSIRYSPNGCDIIGGTSGSPVIAMGTRTVIGVNNTANESGRKCKMNNPCELDEDNNMIVLRDRGYGQQTYQFYTCLGQDFELDLSIPGCQLAKP